jgi:transposase InsO family protein
MRRAHRTLIFVIETFARRIVGWRASGTAHAGFVLLVPERALHDRRLVHRDDPDLPAL